MFWNLVQCDWTAECVTKAQAKNFFFLNVIIKEFKGTD